MIELEIYRRKLLTRLVEKAEKICAIKRSGFLTHYFYLQFLSTEDGDPFARITDLEFLREQIELNGGLASNDNIEFIVHLFNSYKSKITSFSENNSDDSYSVKFNKNFEKLSLFKNLKLVTEEPFSNPAMKRYSRFSKFVDLKKLFLQVYRYRTLFKITRPTMQLSTSDNYYNFIEKTFNIDVECFASPFNRHFKNFCSAFPDIDNSLGSYFASHNDLFNLKNRNASLDCPYQIHIIDKSIDLCENTLELNSKNGFKNTFIFILPYWKDAEFVKRLKICRFTKVIEIVSREASSFELHFPDKPSLVHIHPCPTLAIILSNDPSFKISNSTKLKWLSLI